MFLGSREWPVLEVANLAAICEPVVYTMWNRQHVINLLASASRYEIAVLFICI
jgi:hypothetical protein